MKKGIIQWSLKWRRHQWHTAGGEVRHGDLWEQILWERERSRDNLLIRWVPFHFGVEGNVGADCLVELGRESHPNSHQLLLKRPRRQQQWGATLTLAFCCVQPIHQHVFQSVHWVRGHSIWGTFALCAYGYPSLKHAQLQLWQDWQARSEFCQVFTTQHWR